MPNHVRCFVLFSVCAACFLLFSRVAHAQTVKIRSLPTNPSPSLSDYIPEANASGTPTTYKTTPNSLLALRTLTCTAPLLCAGSTSMTLGADRTLSIAPFYLPLTGGTLTGNIAMGTSKITMAAPYTPASGGAPFRLLTTGSTLTGGSNQGLRTSLMGLYDTRTSANDGTALNVEVLQTSHTSTIVRTGIQCSSYTEPDNGGDTSCILAVASGGGPGITVYKHYGLRPTGLTDQSLSPQPALEVGSGDAGPAILASAGVGVWGTSKTNEAVEQRLGSSTSIGNVVWPTDNVFDTRLAYVVGSPQSNAQPVNITYRVLANGNILTTGKVGVGTAAPTAPLTVSANATTPPTPPTGALIHLINADGTAPRLSLSAFASNGSIDLLRANGTNASQTAINSGEVIGQIAGFAHDGTSMTSTGRVNMQFQADGTWNSSSTPTAVRFNTTLSGATASRLVMVVDNAGHWIMSDSTVPTIACTGTGTSPAAPTIVGTDNNFIATINTGTGSPGSTGTCTVTFAHGTYANTPVMVCMLVKGATAWGNDANLQLTTESTTAPVITWTNLVGGAATALTVSTSYKFSCIVVGRG